VVIGQKLFKGQKRQVGAAKTLGMKNDQNHGLIQEMGTHRAEKRGKCKRDPLGETACRSKNPAQQKKKKKKKQTPKTTKHKTRPHKKKKKKKPLNHPSYYLTKTVGYHPCLERSKEKSHVTDGAKKVARRVQTVYLQKNAKIL